MYKRWDSRSLAHNYYVQEIQYDFMAPWAKYEYLLLKCDKFNLIPRNLDKPIRNFKQKVQLLNKNKYLFSRIIKLNF